MPTTGKEEKMKPNHFAPMECPVCHKFYFSSLTEDDIRYGLAQQCTQCGWKYDLAQVDNPDLPDTENGMSLNEYRAKYRSLLAKDPDYNYLDSNYQPAPHLCPVCHKHLFPDRGSFEICPECGWEDDGLMEYHPDEFAGDANDLCLHDYRKRYEELVKSDPRYRYKKDGIPKSE